MSERIQKLGWIIKLLTELIEQKFEGELVLNFHNGDISKKYSKKVTEHVT